MDRQSTEVLIGIVIIILVAVLYLHRPPVEPKTIASSKPLPTIIKPEAERQITASPDVLMSAAVPGFSAESPQCRGGMQAAVYMAAVAAIWALRNEWLRCPRERRTRAPSSLRHC